MEINEYDQKALALAKEFKTPQHGLFVKLGKIVNSPLKLVNKLINNIPGANKAITKAVGGILNVLNDAATYTVRVDAIIKEFNSDGYKNVKTINDIKTLNLEQIDKVVGKLSWKYHAMAAGEGATAASAPYAALPVLGPGVAPAVLVAVLADIPFITTISLRAIGEYATYYGFDINNQLEQTYLINILNISSLTAGDAARSYVLANLGKLSDQIAKKVVWKELDKNWFTMVVKTIAEQFGLRITKNKLAACIPLAGILFNSGFNVNLINNVCNTAYILYRERYLANYYNDQSLIYKN